MNQDAPPAGTQYAGFWLRAVAAVIDALLFSLITQVLAALMGDVEVWRSIAPDLTRITVYPYRGLSPVLFAWLYFTVLEASVWQATPGKRVMGLIVTDEASARIGFGRANVRYWSKLLSYLILGIGFLMIACTCRKQGLHDLIAGTLVLRR